MSKKKTKQDETKLNSDLEKVLSRLTMDQIRFVVARQETLSDKEAAEAIGMKPKAISNWKQNGVPLDDASRLMAISILESAHHILERNVMEAALVKIAGLRSENDVIRQKVATELLDRIMGKPLQKQEITGRDGAPIQDPGHITIRVFGDD